ADMTIVLPRADATPEVTIDDLATGARRRLPVDVSASLRPHETTVVVFIAPIAYAGGAPPRMWLSVGQPDLRPSTNAVESNTVPVVALVGVDLTDGHTVGRIPLATARDDATIGVGVLNQGLLLAHWTGTGTELLVTTPDGTAPRLVTRLPGFPEIHAPGTVF